MTPADDVAGLYERHALAWHRIRSGQPPESGWLQRFRAAMPADASVLDLGCGTGAPIARYLIEHEHRVIGVDTSPTLIGLCRECLPNGDWVVADMRGLQLDRRFGGILAWHSLFHLTPDDQRSMFDVFRAHALPGAALMFTSGPEQGEVVGTFEGEPLYHGSLDAAEYKERLARAGFAVLRHVPQDSESGGSTVWLARAADVG